MLRWSIVFSRYKVKKNAKIKNRYNHTSTPDPGHHMGKRRRKKQTIKHSIPESQEVSPYQTGYHKAVRNR